MLANPMAGVSSQGIISWVASTRIAYWISRPVVWIRDPAYNLWQHLRPPLADFICKYPYECTAIAAVTCVATIIFISLFWGGKGRGGNRPPDTPARD